MSSLSKLRFVTTILARHCSRPGATSSSISTCSRMLLAPNARWINTDSNITYSGGQATEGQGGFYGSGGARTTGAGTTPPTSEEERHRMLALAADVQNIQTVMSELETLESLLRSEEDPLSSKAMEVKASIKKLMTDPHFVDCLDRLEIEGSPVWGLSSEEREMIIMAREKINNV